jgi:hypothetical protein
MVKVGLMDIERRQESVSMVVPVSSNSIGAAVPCQSPPPDGARR